MRKQICAFRRVMKEKLSILQCPNGISQCLDSISEKEPNLAMEPNEETNLCVPPGDALRSVNRKEKSYPQSFKARTVSHSVSTRNHGMEPNEEPNEETNLCVPPGDALHSVNRKEKSYPQSFKARTVSHSVSTRNTRSFQPD
jgi:hypothetical protein